MFSGRYVFGRKRSPVVRELGLHAVASDSGGVGICGFGHFLDRFVGFCTKNLRIFGFGDHCGLQFAVSVLFRSRFSVFGKNKIGLLDLLCDAVWCFSGFSSENMRLKISTTYTSSLILLAVFGFDRNLFRFCGFIITICKVLRFLMYSDALSGFKPHSSLWSGFVSGCPGFNSTTLCK